MAIPLLETKLYAPRPRRGLVSRPRLSARLGRGVGSKLTLISAPAGFGKSTLLAEWLGSLPDEARSVAWLSLDEGDDQPTSFWTYLISALRTVAPGVGASALLLLQEPQPAMDACLAALLNELGALPNDVVLVLDDYHVIEAPEIHAGVTFLLEHLPHQVHLVIATRADPALPLARLRARGELVEVRASNLRFTADEADAYLNGAMGLGLDAPDIAALEGRTEGWIAALQLAALSLQGRDDIAGFIAGFAGDDRYIVDYLVEEVLQRQRADVRDFLLRTSILGRLTGSLCDALTGRDDGRVMLEALDRANLFLVPLDDRRQWYRYHHLFADVLRAHLADEQSDHLPELHRRASEWYEANGERSEAIDHALAGADFDRAADLIELTSHALRASRQEFTLRRWLDGLPDSVFDTRPVLAIAHAGAMLASGELDAAEQRRAAARLTAAERWVPAARDEGARATAVEAGMIVRHTDVLTHLPSAITVYRAALARMRGDAAEAIAHARSVLASTGPDQPLERGAAAGFLGLAYWTSGDLEVAHGWWSQTVAYLEQAGHIADVMGVSIALADIRIAQGRLREAMRTYERALQLGADAAAGTLRGMADMHVGMSEVLRERNELAAAMRQLRTSDELGASAGLAQNAYRSRVALAHVREAEGDLDAALELLDEAERRYAGDYFPNVRPIPAMRARLWIAQGRLGDALTWTRERGLTTDDELSYLLEFEHITLARLLLASSARGPGGPAMVSASRFLGRLLGSADQGERSGSIIEILVLQALALQHAGDPRGALGPLERALTMAEPEGYVRRFVDEGAPMATLLGSAARQGIAPDYVRGLLAAFGSVQQRPPHAPGLVEPLSDRELDVLRLLGTDLSGPDIARELVLSLHTVRSHTKNVYAKLGVNDRRAAVRRAAELDLLPRNSGRQDL